MEKKILVPSVLALFVASAAHAGATFDTAAGTLYLGADVEFDYTSEGGEKFNNRVAEDADADLFSSGRLLLDINGEKVLENGNFAGFKLNPVWGQNGDAGADDIWIKFGVKNDWAIQAGHFEAIDLSPAGQDTYIAESGTVMYRANFARGRNDESGGGQMTFSKTMGDAAGFEVTAQSLNDGDTVVVRPVVTYAADKLSMVAGAEIPALANEEDYNNIVGTPDDGADWFGLGGAASYAATDDLTLTVRAAFLTDDRVDDNSVDAYTAGINAQYQYFFIAALYGEADADVDTFDTEELQIYASYKIPAILDVDNFDIYLGAGYSDAEVNGVSKDDVVGARVRLKYIF